VISADHYVQGPRPPASGVSVPLGNTTGVCGAQIRGVGGLGAGGDDGSCVMLEKDGVCAGGGSGLPCHGGNSEASSRKSRRHCLNLLLKGR